MNCKRIPKLTSSDLERFTDKADVCGPDDCWEWTAGKNKAGYGTIHIQGGMYISHRVAYFIRYGVDPGELLVCHKCDNPSCVNPDHLFLGTHQDNSDDKVSKGRDVHARGEQCGMAKLTEQDVQEILESDKTNTVLATHFGVRNCEISDIKRGKIWKHVKGNRHTSHLQRNNTTGVRGVHFKVGKYEAVIKFQKKYYYLGRFDTIAEAEKALIAKRIKLKCPLKKEN